MARPSWQLSHLQAAADGELHQHIVPVVHGTLQKLHLTPHQTPTAPPYLQTVADDEISMGIEMMPQWPPRTQVGQRLRVAKADAAASCAVMSGLCLPECVELVQHVEAAILGHLHALCTGNSMWAIEVLVRVLCV